MPKRASRVRWSWVVLAAPLALGACDGCGAPPEPHTAEPAERTSAAASTERATIHGVVRLAPGAELPRYGDHPLAITPGRPEFPENCTAPSDDDAVPVTEDSGGLRGLAVAIDGFSTAPEHEPETHEVAITDCRLAPGLVVATRGDTLRLTNETDYPFLPDLGLGLMQGLLHERSRDLELAQGGVRAVTCGFAAPCGRLEVLTLYHGLHDRTGDEGRFRIEGVPPGEEVRVVAWHPLFQEASERVTLRPGEERELTITITPAPPQQPTVQRPRPPGSDTGNDINL